MPNSNRWEFGVPDHEYHANDGRISSSGCKLIKRTPAHYWAACGPDASPKEDSPAFRLGKLAHAITLEGEDTAKARYFVPGKHDKRTKVGKAAYAAEIEANAGKDPVSLEEWNAAMAMSESVHGIDYISDMIHQGEPEVSGYYFEPISGAPAKIRPDVLIDGNQGVILDLKTTQNASPQAFARDAANYGYHLSAAMYADGYKHITGRPLDLFVLVVVEKAAPFAVAVYVLDEAAMETGREQYLEAVETYTRCSEFGVWQPYPTEIQSLSLPGWATPNHY